MGSSAHDLLVGRTLGEFVLRERIGEGGFGAVYRASQPALEREAVVKVLHPQLHASRAATERFLREARLASKLDHPYAAHIYAFGAEPDGELWIAMEHVRGTPLDQILKLQGPLSLERFAPLLDRLCEVVHNAHEQGIIHRDIKPANVMVLVRSGRLLPKLLDFGIAKGATPGTPVPEHTLPRSRVTPAELDALPIADTAAPELSSPPVAMAPELTQRGAIMGSPLYMAPEQWLDAGHVESRTDLYALAVLAYECLTGKPPFTGATVTHIAQAHARAAVPPLGGRFPAALDKFFATALAKRPADRHADALAFATAFRQAAGIASETVQLPALPAERRDAVLARAPQPIADAIAALEAARNAHQARDALALAARAIIRYIGLLAVACRSRVSVGDEPPTATRAIRELSRRSLADLEWLELARALTSSWKTRRDAYPIPELVDALHGGDVAADLEALVALRDRETAGDDALLARLDRAIARLASALDGLVFLSEYPLVTTIGDGRAERWTGARTQRTTIAVRGRELPAGEIALLDAEGAPVLSLAPLFQLATPTPGAPAELFLFDGRDARGARFVTFPGGFEHHDDRVWSWFRAQLADSIDDSRGAADGERPPYRGLAAFSVEDGASFVGREKLVDELANRLRVQPLLAVVGRSGAGKSSLVHAGVVPALHGWRAIALRPGALPLAALSARLEHAGLEPISRAAIANDRDALGAHLRADAARRGPIVLVVDQLEELFTLCSDHDERVAFAGAIAAAARSADDPVRVIVTLRDDFLVRSEDVPALRNRIGHGLQLLAVPDRDDLVRILVEPARRVGYEFDDAALPAEMVDDVVGQPGALALLSFAAAKLWELRDRHFRQLTRSAYATLGGVGGALARHADLTLDALPGDERALAREGFRHLVTSQGTRAVLARKDLRELLGSTAQADEVVEKLVAARLLVASESDSGEVSIEIIHEALLVAWPRLVEWMREDVEGAHFREQLRTAAEQWHERRRAKGLVWRGDALADFTRWRARHAGPLTEIENAFAEASLAADAGSRRNRRLLLAGVIGTLVAVVLGLAVFSRRLARQRAAAEQAASELHDNLERQFEDQGRRLVLGGDPLQALAYLHKAGELGAAGRSHDFLVAQAAQATDGQLFVVHHDEAVRSPRFSSDGTRLLTASLDHTARVWDARTGAALLTLHEDDAILAARFAPDDATILTASYSGNATVWDARTGRAITHLRHGGNLRCAAYSPDSTLVLTTSEDGVAVVWTTGGEARARVRFEGTHAGACTFAPDGRTFVVGSATGVTRIWNATTGALVHELRGQHDQIRTAEFSPDGTLLVTGSTDGTGYEWNAQTGERAHVLEHRGGVRARFSSDGAFIVTASDDRTAVIWDAHTGAKLHSLEGHTAELTGAAFSPDGRYVATTAGDAAWLWDRDGGRVVARWRGHQDRILDLAFDPTGSRVATVSDDDTAIVWRVEVQESVRWLGTEGWSGELSHDGARLVLGGKDGHVRVWDATSGVLQLDVAAHAEAISTVAFNHDDRMIASVSADGVVRITDARDGHAIQVVQTASKTEESGLAWSKADVIVQATFDGWIRAWDATSGHPRFERKGHGGFRVYAAAFDATGSRLITTGADLATRIWDVDGNPLAEFHHAEVRYSLHVEPSGIRVVSAGDHQRATVWNLATGQTENQLVGARGFVRDAKWSPDGSWVVTATSDGATTMWDARTGDPLAVYAYGFDPAVGLLSPRSDSLLLVHSNGGAAMVGLPRARDNRELDHLMSCRVPYFFDGKQLKTRTPIGCGP